MNRTLKFAVAKYQSTVPPSSDPPGPLSPSADDVDAGFIADVNRLLQTYNTLMDSVRLREGLQVVMQLSARGNLYLQGAGLNNALLESNPQRCALVISRAINLIWILSALVGPFMPAVEQGILRQLNCPPRTIPGTDEPGGFGIDLLGGHVLGKTEYLFTRIEDSKAETWRAMFGSTSGAANAAADAGEKETKGKGKQKKEKGAQSVEANAGSVSGAVKEKGKKVKDPRARRGEKKDGTTTEMEGGTNPQAEVKKDTTESTSEIPVPSTGSGATGAETSL